ncbi:PBECR4 domain-containing protein [Gemelliphila palaticanis]|uniref:Phage-Barnase-EndoU-ColicinE5/D-RelE like nuclease 4 domain-containing protein n=1 Tax=Gemelliphila palaticanis TaxID=81950 RepID=A0ABX2T0W7_9BACL|nr:PBECR4 domain-containing protein [Gemella palaticanis]MBF0715347.1 hypothetical protein [Gemella palaticanis]NYS47277.1 hypothetical protein [Gemella palaticanis]
MNKIKEILEWYKQFNKSDIVIKTTNNEFGLEISNKSLPHLLGMQYATKNSLRGYRLYEFISNKTDEEIYNLIRENNSEMLNSIKERVNSFKYFMENLDEAILVEQTHPNTKIKSDHLLVKGNNGNYLQIGIARDREDTDYFETYIVRNDDIYFKDSNIKEKVISIEKYVDDELVPFSFDKKKELKLLLDYYDKKEKSEYIEQSTERNDNLEVDFFVPEEPALYGNIPEDMKKESRWAIIKIISIEEQKKQIQNNKKLSEEEKEEKISKIKKAKKLPISITGEMANSTDPDTWSSYKEAVEFIKGKEKNHTLAFALGGGYIGIDLDDILEEGRAYMKDKENSKSMTADFLREIDTYAEMSPSGKGLHLIGYGELPGEYKRQGNLEIYDKNRFFTVTGKIITDKDRTKINNIDDSLKPLYDKYIGSNKNFKTLRKFEKINSNITEDRLVELMLTPDKYKNLSKDDLLEIYKGNWERYPGIFPSQSEADWYMVVRAIYFSSGDIEKSRNVLLKSGLHRDKWETTRGRGVPYLDYLLNKAFQTVDFPVKSNLTKEQQLFIKEVRKSDNLNFLSVNNYNYYKENMYKNMNNAILNSFKVAHNYSSNKWITASQIKNYNEELSFKDKNANLLEIKNIDDYCEVNLNIRENNENNFIKIKLYNLDNVINVSEKSIKEYENKPIKNIQQLIVDKPDMEATFISALLGEQVILSRDIIEKTSDEDILKSFKNANKFVNDVTKSIPKEEEIKKEDYIKNNEEKTNSIKKEKQGFLSNLFQNIKPNFEDDIER